MLWGSPLQLKRLFMSSVTCNDMAESLSLASPLCSQGNISIELHVI